MIHFLMLMLFCSLYGQSGSDLMLEISREAMIHSWPALCKSNIVDIN